MTGQYSKMVRHGGMIGYVLDGKVSDAMNDVEANIRERHEELCMNPPGAFQPSAALAGESRARETHPSTPYAVIRPGSMPSRQITAYWPTFRY